MASQTPSTAKDGIDPSVQSSWQQDQDIAHRYKAAENATRPFAKISVELSEQLTTLKATPVRILDLASGTGAVEAEIYAAVPKEQWGDLDVLAGDISQPMLDYLAQRAVEEGWTGLKTKFVDGAKLNQNGVDTDMSEGFAHVFVGFAIFMLPPDTVKALVGMVLPGGTLAVSSWRSLPWYGLLKKTYERIDDGPEIPSEDQLRKSLTNGQPWHEVGFVRDQLSDAGLQEVQVVQRKFNVDCSTPEVFMTTMGFMLKMLSKQWPEEKREGWLKEVGEVMKGIVVQESGGEEEHVFMEFEGVVGVGLKGE